MKVMFYCQHVLGIGHFFRSMAIAEALYGHEVHFVEGGDPVPNFAAPSHVRRHLLPSLMMDADFKVLKAQGEEVDAVKERRMALLKECFLDISPDVLVTELFPFGRKQFRFELVPILELIRSRGMEGGERTRVVCSLRDILVEKSDQNSYEEKVLKTLHEYYHLLLIHSDPGFVALDETFPGIGRIRIPVKYTGFVVRPSPERHPRQDGRRMVLASSGGGKVGVDLLEATIRAIRLVPWKEVNLRVFVGPFMEPCDRETLYRLAQADPRVSIHPFSLDFPSELAQADLSVSMGGYNTCMDILSVGVPSLVHPFPQNREQALRASRLEAIGALRVLPNLDPVALSAAIRKGLEETTRLPRSVLDLSGAEKTARAIEKLVYQSP